MIEFLIIRNKFGQWYDCWYYCLWWLILWW